jgi:hypothetical protein
MTLSLSGAIIGGIFATIYSPQIVKLLAPFKLPDAARSAAEQSVGATFAVSE